MRSETEARRLRRRWRPKSASRLRRSARATSWSARPGDIIPSDGEITEGIASVDESAITGESAPVIRESGGDRSAVTGGTKVLSDRIVVRITAERGQTFLDRMISLVEGANRQKTPNEIALTILLAVLTIVFLPVVVVLQPFGNYSPGRRAGGGLVVILVSLLVCLIPTTIGALAVGHRHCRDGPVGATQRARHERAGRGSRRRRPDLAARQDRHDHPGQPPGLRFPPRRCHTNRSWPPRPSSPPWPTRRPRGVRSWCWPKTVSASANASSAEGHSFVPFSATTRMSGLDLGGQQDPQGRGRIGETLGQGAGRDRTARPRPHRRERLAFGRHASSGRRREGHPRRHRA